MRLTDVLGVLGICSVNKTAPLTGSTLLPFLRSILHKPHRGSFASEAKVPINDTNQSTPNLGQQDALEAPLKADFQRIMRQWRARFHGPRLSHEGH